MPKWSVYGPFILRDPIAEDYSHYFVELNLEQDSWIPGGGGLAYKTRVFESGPIAWPKVAETNLTWLLILNTRGRLIVQLTTKLIGFQAFS